MANLKEFKNITIVISSLGSGGAERVAVELALGFFNRGKNITIVTFLDEKKDFYSLPSSIKRIKLSNKVIENKFKNKMINNIGFLMKLRKKLVESNPDVIISFMPQTNMKVQMCLFGVNIPIIVTEHSDPKRLKSNQFWYFFRYLIYPFSSKVISVSKGIDNYFWWINKSKKSVIYNPLTKIDVGINTFNKSIDSFFYFPKTIVSMGRLDYNKGFDILINCFIKIEENYPDWQLLILGEGKERVKLEKMVKKAKIEERILLPGRFLNPFDILRKADIFALTSRNEGFGNVIIEAMACGLPVIAMESMGPAEIIKHDINGILAKNEEEFINKLKEIMEDSDKRNRLARSASNDLEKYDINSILNNWEKEIKSIL